MLISNVALPFIALAGTGPILQALFAKRFPDTSPYPLYALSNFGSLLALLCFPFVLEPWISVSATSPLWSGGFAIAGGSVLACVWLATSRGNVVGRLDGEGDGEHQRSMQAPVGAEQRVAWMPRVKACRRSVTVVGKSGTCVPSAALTAIRVPPTEAI